MTTPGRRAAAALAEEIATYLLKENTFADALAERVAEKAAEQVDTDLDTYERARQPGPGTEADVPRDQIR